MPNSKDIPIQLAEGWPVPFSDAPVTAREAGIVLGSLLLSEAEWSRLAAHPD